MRGGKIGEKQIKQKENMHQIIETTHKEKVEMYRMIDKERLIEMLIEANRCLASIKPTIILPKPN